jgi:hypothetical protein
MTHLKRFLAISLFLFLFLSLFSSYEKNQPSKKEGTIKQGIVNTAKSPGDFPFDSSSCDPGIWKHVYNPTRLKVINKCVTVTGVITESHVEADGDQHLLLKPDGGHENLLTRKNLKNKKGNLVIEAVCINNITEKKVGGACKGYINHITIPSVGAHVKVSGSLVLDTHNGWNEIHPVSKIVIQ